MNNETKQALKEGAIAVENALGANIGRLRIENARLRVALHDVIRRTMINDDGFDIGQTTKGGLIETLISIQRVAHEALAQKARGNE